MVFISPSTPTERRDRKTENTFLLEVMRLLIKMSAIQVNWARNCLLIPDFKKALKVFHNFDIFKFFKEVFLVRYLSKNNSASFFFYLGAKKVVDFH